MKKIASECFQMVGVSFLEVCNYFVDFSVEFSIEQITLTSVLLVSASLSLVVPILWLNDEYPDNKIVKWIMDKIFPIVSYITAFCSLGMIVSLFIYGLSLFF